MPIIITSLKVTTLASTLKVWIDVLMRAGVGVEVCHVDDKENPKSNKPAKGKGKISKSRKVGRARTCKTENDDEEVDQ